MIVLHYETGSERTYLSMSKEDALRLATKILETVSSVERHKFVASTEMPVSVEERLGGHDTHSAPGILSIGVKP